MEDKSRVVILSKKLILLGDSIIDNKTYVQDNELSVLEHIQSISNFETQQLALDGATTDHVLESQLNNISDDVSNLVLSVGGNDLLNEIDFLYENLKYTPNNLLEAVLGLLSPIAANYEAIVKKLSTYRAKILCATVYEGDLVGSDEFDAISHSSKAMVSLLNDSIFRVCHKYNIQTIELRNIFTKHEDYANPIEPSHLGGMKFAKKIVKWVQVDT